MKKQLDLGLYLIPTFAPNPEALPLYEKTYKLWKQVWQDTLSELDGTETVYSDDFIRQDFAAVITVSGEPVALCCFKSMDLRLRSHREDSWFKPWPTATLEALADRHSACLVPSWLTVHPEYRRTRSEFAHDLAAIAAEMIALATLETGAEIAFGTPRVDRSVSRLLYNAGAVAVHKNIPHHGVPVDLVTLTPDTIKEAMPRMNFDTHRLWKARIDLRASAKAARKKSA